jgi:general secretion pathway protein B
MSYILEALKKSEMERQHSIQQEDDCSEIELNVASVMPVKKIKDEGSNWVLKGVYLALLVILVLILLKLFDTSKVSSDIKSLPEDTSVDVSPVKNSILETPIMDALEEENKPHTLTKSNLATKEMIAIEQAPEEVLATLPGLAISSHIYSTQPERRSIVVNSERLQEGGFIAPQVQVKEITHQGMVIEVNGWSLVVGRSRGWSQQ